MSQSPSEQPRKKRARKVVIAGGGIGGLALALALQRRGLEVVVYERDAEFTDRQQGYGMTMSTTNTALAELGILDELRVRDTQSHSHYVFRSDGAVLGYFGAAFTPRHPSKRRKHPEASTFGDTCDTEVVGTPQGQDSSESTRNGEDSLRGSTARGNLRVPRQVLRQMLLQRLDQHAVRWGRMVVGYTDTPERPQVLVTLSDGSQDSCDVLVGADGLRSVVRQRKSADMLKYLGVMGVVGITPYRHPLLSRRGFYTYDGRHRMFTMPFTEQGDSNTETAPVVPSDAKENSDGSTQTMHGDRETDTTMWQLTFAVDESEARRLKSLPRSELVEYLCVACKDWHDPTLAMMKATPPEDIWANPLYDRDPMPSSRKGSVPSRVTVVGDAAHPMSMFKGQGANTALWSACRLAHCLATLPIAPALRQYEREMLHRSSPRVLASRESARVLHSMEAINTAPSGAYGIAGVPTEKLAHVLAELERQHITATTNNGRGLDEEVQRVIDETCNPGQG
eukprot:m.113698 g.113698  ORF g.113698 m.113698 type:complete len:509 (+) comp17095_c0_seq3:416-1942(+)